HQKGDNTIYKQSNMTKRKKTQTNYWLKMAQIVMTDRGNICFYILPIPFIIFPLLTNLVIGNIS
ncbi:hypothetical protein ACJX0J_032539, partial [Zea mays]